MSARQPVLFLSHGAPPLADDATWTGQLHDWSSRLDKPTSVLMVSAHWENQPVTVSSTRPGTPLVYDFWGFPQKYYDVIYDARSRLSWPPASPASSTALRMPSLRRIEVGVERSPAIASRCSLPSGPKAPASRPLSMSACAVR